MCAPAHLIEFEELLLLLESVSGDGGAVAADGMLTKAVVTIRVCPLQDAPAVHHLHRDNKVRTCTEIAQKDREAEQLCNSLCMPVY